MKSDMVKYLARLKLTVAVALLTIFALASTMPVFAESPHLKMGNPSGATTDLGNKNNFLMEKEYFALAYNNGNGTPNWVSWRLVKTDLGSAQRMPFHPDEDLPTGFKVVLPADYTGAGFDRGHMCPHSDRASSDVASAATFAMSNMIPQSPNVNQKAWDQLESYCRDLVQKHGKTLYIIDGPAGNGGTGKNGFKEIVGRGRINITVPAKCWKVIMVLNAGTDDDLDRITTETRLIAVIMPNDMTVGEEWAKFRVSVKEVEQLTGYTFFDKAPKLIIEPLKEKTDDESIAPAKPIYRGSRS